MAEGDTILRAARRIAETIGGEQVEVSASNPRGRASGVQRLDGRTLGLTEARGKHLLLRFDDLVLHSHLGMHGSWHVYPRGLRRRGRQSLASSRPAPNPRRRLLDQTNRTTYWCPSCQRTAATN